IRGSGAVQSISAPLRDVCGPWRDVRAPAPTEILTTVRDGAQARASLVALPFYCRVLLQHVQRRGDDRSRGRQTNLPVATIPSTWTLCPTLLKTSSVGRQTRPRQRASSSLTLFRRSDAALRQAVGTVAVAPGSLLVEREPRFRDFLVTIYRGVRAWRETR